MARHRDRRREGFPPAPLCAAGLLLGASGVVHLALTGEHFDEGTWQGILFLGDGIALSASSLWLVASGSSPSRVTAAAVAVLTAGAYFLSRTVGIPVFGRETWDQLGVWTSAGEIAGAFLALRGATGHRKWDTADRADAAQDRGAFVVVGDVHPSSRERV
jgi:hypothetical protein